ncbi:MAG: hypothetical protein AAFP84_18035 [Actinomycetota bacterium]
MSADAHVDVDQIIVRKVGGYNMESVAWWVSQSPGERQRLLADRVVQFFGNGQEIDPALAAASLEVVVEPDLASSEPSIATLVFPQIGREPVNTVYERTVVTGPRWEIHRRTAAGVELLTAARGWGDVEDPYDLNTPAGNRNLAGDLLADSLGYDRSYVDEIRDAIEHFAVHVLQRQLGNRVWQVTAESIRGTVTENPFLKLVAPDTQPLG